MIHLAKTFATVIPCAVMTVELTHKQAKKERNRTRDETRVEQDKMRCKADVFSATLAPGEGGRPLYFVPGLLRKKQVGERIMKNIEEIELDNFFANLRQPEALASKNRLLSLFLSFFYRKRKGKRRRSLSLSSFFSQELRRRDSSWANITALMASKGQERMRGPRANAKTLSLPFSSLDLETFRSTIRS